MFGDDEHDRRKRAKLIEIDNRYRADRRSDERSKIGINPNLSAFRTAEIRKFLRWRYGPILPEDDAARDDLYVLARHVVGGRHGIQLMRNIIEISAPWMSEKELEKLIDRAQRSMERWNTEQLAHRLRLTYAVRQELNIRTIGSVDVDRDERLARAKKRKRERDRLRMRRKRAEGRPPRKNLSREKPWLVEGISRTEWYRRRAEKPGTKKSSHTEGNGIISSPHTED